MCIACLTRFGRALPERLVDFGCSAAVFDDMRRAVLPWAQGTVVEIGFGSGHSLPFYDAARVSRIVGVEPDAGMRQRAEPGLQKAPFPVEVVAGRGEALPLPSRTADTVVLGYVLCTVASPAACLSEAARVLKPDGRLVFCEHAQAKRAFPHMLQRSLSGLWVRLASGCRLLSDPLQLLEEAGFRCSEIRQSNFHGPLGVLGRHLGGWAAAPGTRTR